jgi:hypothetical protein
MEHQQIDLLPMRHCNLPVAAVYDRQVSGIKMIAQFTTGIVTANGF